MAPDEETEADRSGFPHRFDPIYFLDASWSSRLATWRAENLEGAFAAGNEKIVIQLLSDLEAGLRAVVNITNASLLAFLDEGRYRNLYQQPMIGGIARRPSPTRIRVDQVLGLSVDTCFAAVALGGAGVRYYGEYCMVLRRDAVGQGTGLFDRDSYDIFEPPLNQLDLNRDRIERLSGRWPEDLEAMVAMKVLPELAHDRRLATTGTISEAILRDQEFIEVHLRHSFGPSSLEELRESPDEVAVEARIGDKADKRRHVTAVEQEWVRRRDLVGDRLEGAGIRTRIVTTHGRGYQWA